MNDERRGWTRDEDSVAVDLLDRVARRDPQARDPQAMEQLYGLYQDAIYRFVLTRCEADVAAQVLHELMVDLWSARRVPPEGQHPRTWLLGCAARAAAFADVAEDEIAIDPSTASMSAARESQRASENLHTVLARLSPRYRGTVYLAYCEHLCDAEIAQVLDRPEAAVRWDRMQGRDALAALQPPRGEIDARGRDLFLDAWLRRELRMPPQSSPGDFGLDRLRVAMRQIDRERRRGAWTRVLRRLHDGLLGSRVATVA